MIIGSKHRLTNIINELKIKFGEAAIKCVAKSKTLGEIIDELLTWKNQWPDYYRKSFQTSQALERYFCVVASICDLHVIPKS